MTRPKATGSAADFLPEQLTLAALREAAAGCRGCQLWQVGTKPSSARGPRMPGRSSSVSSRATRRTGPGHPSSVPRGASSTRRSRRPASIGRPCTSRTRSSTSSGRHAEATHPPEAERDRGGRLSPWLEAELAAVRPRVLVLLGATAAQSLLGREFRVTQHRGEMLESDLAGAVTATVHPSSILRGEPEEREQNFNAFVDDLKLVAKLL